MLFSKNRTEAKEILRKYFSDLNSLNMKLKEDLTDAIGDSSSTLAGLPAEVRAWPEAIDMESSFIRLLDFLEHIVSQNHCYADRCRFSQLLNDIGIEKEELL